MGERQMSKLFLVFMFAFHACSLAFADTPPARAINSQTYDGSGAHAITATSNGGHEGLDVNVINPSGGNTNTNIFDSSGNALNSTSNALNSYVTNFPSTFNVGNFPSSFGASQVGSWTVGATISNFPATQAVTQSGTWTTGRTWTLNSSTDSVTISGSVTTTNSANGNVGSTAPAQATQVAGVDGSGDLQPLQVDSGTKLLKVDGSAVTQPVSGTFWQTTQPVSGTFFQATQPVSGTVAATQSGSWTVGATISNFPSTQAVTQSGSWTTGRTWTLSHSTDSIASWAFDGTGNAIGSTTGALNVNVNNTVPVTGTFFQATQPVSGTFFQATQPVSGTVNAAQSGSWTVVVGNINAGRTSIATVINNYVSTNVTTSAYVTLISATASTITELNIFDSSGRTLYLSYALTCGALASSVNTILVTPGGNGSIDWAIPSGVCLGIEAQSANATAGVFNASFLQ